MSTTTSAPAQTLDLSKSGPVPFPRLLKVELRKSYDTRAGFWLLLVTALLAVGAMVVALVVILIQDAQVGLTDFVQIANFISGFLLPILGIMLLTSEWSQRTAMVTFTLEARRGRIVAAKLIAGLLLALIVALIATVAAFAVNAIYSAAHGDASWSFGVAKFGGFLLGQGFAMLTGFAFAALLLNTAAAIVVYFAYSFIVPTVFAVLAGLVESFGPVRDWIDFNQAQQPLFNADMTSKDWAQLLVSGLIWLGLPLALGLWRMLRAEVK